MSRFNYDGLEGMAELVKRLGVTIWSVFFLVPTGRGKALEIVSPEEHEKTYHWLYDISQRESFRVRTTAAPAYRRVVIQRTKKAMEMAGERNADEVQWEQTGAGYAYRGGRAPLERGVNDGDGFCFVDHLGNVYPSGFLPIVAGNVRQQHVKEIYCDSKLFRELRDKTLLKGKCGVCEFRTICGGSRARAYSLTGDYLAAEPTCVYQSMEV